MSKATDDFWNELAITQMAAGQAPSVKTKDMQKALNGDKKSINKISKSINTSKAILDGLHARK